MVQVFTEDSYDPDHVADVDLENMEDNFLALKSLFSGASSPSNPVAGMPWFDTGQEVLKFRDVANSAWLGLMHGDASQKIIVYRNTALSGWLIDTGVTDCVLALKGGSQAYNVAAAQVAGTWNQPDHTLVESETPAHDHGSTGNHVHAGSIVISGASYALQHIVGESNVTLTGMGTQGAHTHTSFGGDGAHNHGTTYRPRAAICTLQYLDL